MNRVEEKLDALVRVVKESPEYREYQRVRELVHQDPEKEKAVHEFRRRNFELHQRRDGPVFGDGPSGKGICPPAGRALCKRISVGGACRMPHGTEH